MLEDYANIFNNRKLYLKFNGLQKAFFDKLKDSKILSASNKRWTLFMHYFIEFKYHLYSAYYLLEQLEQLEKAIMTQYIDLRKSIEFQNEKKFGYDSFIVQEYLLRIMPFLNMLFLLQDRLIIILQLFLDIEIKAPKQNPNESNKDYKYRLRRFRNRVHSFASFANNYYGISKLFPEEIIENIMKYWIQNGQELRQYRNLKQHQFNLLEEAYIVRNPEDRFVLYLPDNPYEQNFDRLSYDKKRIAYDYFNSELEAFHDFIEKLMKLLGTKSERHEFASNMSPKSDSISNYEQGDLLKIWILKNEAILFSVGEKTPEGSAAKLKFRKIENKMNVLKWEIK